jgi:ankyrin repeat protein
MFPTIDELQEIVIHRHDFQKFKKMVDKIDRKDIDRKIPGLRGKTLLHLIAEAGEMDMMNLLLEKNASYCIKDDYGRTPQNIIEEQLENNLASQFSDKVNLKYRSCLDILEYVSSVEKNILKR